MNLTTPPSVTYDLQVNGVGDDLELLLSKTTYGVVETKSLRRDFFRSPEYRLTGKLADTLHDLIQSGATVHRGNAQQAVSNV